MTDENVLAQLHLVQQNLQHIVVQKQQMQRNLAEVESALKGLESTKKSYKLLGGIMVEADTKTLQKELNDKKEVLLLRLKNLDVQEEMVQRKTEELQKQASSELKKK